MYVNLSLLVQRNTGGLLGLRILLQWKRQNLKYWPSPKNHSNKCYSFSRRYSKVSFQPPFSASIFFEFYSKPFRFLSFRSFRTPYRNHQCRGPSFGPRRLKFSATSGRSSLEIRNFSAPLPLEPPIDALRWKFGAFPPRTPWTRLSPAPLGPVSAPHPLAPFSPPGTTVRRK